MSENLYSCFHRSRRDVAVMFMVDMSGSTRGWVNLVEREALVIALRGPGDVVRPLRHLRIFRQDTQALWKFTGVKKFEEACTAQVRARISGIKPRTYTRMGVAIRHLGKYLQALKARSRLLITLSDGKPEDYGGYRGRLRLGRHPPGHRGSPRRRHLSFLHYHRQRGPGSTCLTCTAAPTTR